MQTHYFVNLIRIDDFMLCGPPASLEAAYYTAAKKHHVEGTKKDEPDHSHSNTKCVFQTSFVEREEARCEVKGYRMEPCISFMLALP
ncbi:unnamed protein product [Phytomonas sp. Hart1]|nr:unnamed protein product [Phytomonas sp. Hart1]|eukprot:CCW66697.1 unnamed protein product [Phytomonas sp. isolate Hart1]